VRGTIEPPRDGDVSTLPSPGDAAYEGARSAGLEALGRVANERFVANAPEDVVAAERAKLERYRSELAALEG